MSEALVFEHHPLKGYKLPANWLTVSIGQVARSVASGFPSGAHNSEGKGIPHIRPMNIDREGRFDLSSVKYVEEEPSKLFCKGVVLFNNTNSPELIGNTTAILVDTKLAYSNHMTRVHLEEGLNPVFVARQLHFLWMSGYFRHRCNNHVNQASISAEPLADSVPLLLPPAPEQGRIADVLDELLSDLDAGVAALERVQAKLKHYRAAVLNAAVEGLLVPGATPYRSRRIGAAIESLGQGWSPKCESQPAADSETWAVIKTTAIQPLRYLEQHNKTLPAALKPRPHLELTKGDLLITRAGPRTRVGITCLIKRTRPHLLLCDKAYRLRCKKDTLSAAFLEVVLNAPRIVAALDKLKTGINDSGLNLTQDRFAELVVPFPAPDKQAAIVEAVEDQFSVIEHVEADLEAKLKSAQALRLSIFRHAFTGQLSPQDPKDEPAPELLKRIDARREEFVRQVKTARKTRAEAPQKRAVMHT